MEIEKDRLVDAFCFLTRHLSRREFTEGVLSSYLCGKFHTYPKQAKAIMAEAKAVGVIKKRRTANGLIWEVLPLEIPKKVVPLHPRSAI